MSSFECPLKMSKTYRSWLGRCNVDRRLQRITMVGPWVKLRRLWFVCQLLRSPETFSYWWTRLAWQAELTDVGTYPYSFTVTLKKELSKLVAQRVFHKRGSRREWSWRTYWMKKKSQLTSVTSRVIPLQTAITLYHLSCYGLITSNNRFCRIYNVKMCLNGDQWSECLFYHSFFYTQRWLVNWFLRITLNSS